MPLDSTSAQFWDAKYRFKTPEKDPIDLTVEDTWRRVAAHLASVEKDPDFWARQFYDAMAEFQFIPGGRILANAGTGRDTTLFNCYIMGEIEDSMEGIFQALKESALTLRMGGGVGMDFSTIRPAGSLVRGIGSRARGPLAFMDAWDAMARTMVDAGDRVAAQMGILRCNHPDIEAFIEAKRTPGRLTQFNLSVAVTDAFVQAIRDDAPWDLQFGGEVLRTVPARELWDRIMRATYAYAEPGVLFIDRINAENTLWYCEAIRACNPCGEIATGPYSSCLLGSINLAVLVKDPFTRYARMDRDRLSELVPTAIRMMDNVNDVSNFPLPQQREQALAKRRLGLGITGLGDALAMCGMRYGSPDAVAAVDDWMGTIEMLAYRASAELAREKGSFPLYDRDKYLAGKHVLGLDEETRRLIAEHGMRNSHVGAVAPTGTISLFADNVSGGAEPIFALEYTRKVRQPDGSYREEIVQDYAYKVWRESGCPVTEEERDDAMRRMIPPALVTTAELAWRDHVAMLAAVQRHVDQSVSKTINLPEDIPFEEFREVYLAAYDAGCKSCTTYRPNDVTGSVLVAPATSTAVARRADPPPPMETLDDDAPRSDFRARPDVLDAKVYKLRWNGTAMYLTVGDEVKPDGRRIPMEVLLTSRNVDSQHWISALTRMMTAVMRRDADFSFIPTELMQVYSAKGGEFQDGRYVPSEVALIGKVLRDHFIEAGYMKPAEEATVPVAGPPVGAVGFGQLGAMCPVPDCGQPAVIREAGCMKCMSCGWSNCG